MARVGSITVKTGGVANRSSKVVQGSVPGRPLTGNA